MADELSAKDELTRFVYKSREFRPDGTVKPPAFKPSNRDQEASVFLLESMNANARRQHGRRYGRQDREAKGYAVVLVSDCTSIGLSAHLAEPPPRHGAIRGWPEARELRLEKASLLASAASSRSPVKFDDA